MWISRPSNPAVPSMLKHPVRWPLWIKHVIQATTLGFSFREHKELYCTENTAAVLRTKNATMAFTASPPWGCFSRRQWCRAEGLVLGTLKLNLVSGHFRSGGNRTPKHSPTIMQPTPRGLLSNPKSKSLLPWGGASLLGLD